MSVFIIVGRESFQDIEFVLNQKNPKDIQHKQIASFEDCNYLRAFGTRQSLDCMNFQKYRKPIWSLVRSGFCILQSKHGQSQRGLLVRLPFWNPTRCGGIVDPFSLYRVSENYGPTSYYRSWAYYLSFKDTPTDLIVRETLTGTMPVHRFFTMSTFFCMLLVMVLKSTYGGTEV